MEKKVSVLYTEVMERIKQVHVSCFLGMEKPLFLISEQYPGLWLEHVYDSVMLAQLEPEYLPVAENAIALFIDRQSEEGQLPFAVMDRRRRPELSEVTAARFFQIQECVSFFSLALEVFRMNGDHAFLQRAYEAGCLWDGWLRAHRMTTGRGLVEMFFGFDTGHDHSGRLAGMACPGNYMVGGLPQTADTLPPDDGVTPILAVDMNCNFYATERALAEMAALLGKGEEAVAWGRSAAEVKRLLFAYCYDEGDAFFYDVARAGNKRKYRSSAIFHLFLEGVLDPREDAEIIERIYREHIKNPEEFWTEYPFPSMALSDPSVEGHRDFNCWGYYTQGLIVVRCSRWMDKYGWSQDYDYILRKWIEAWVTHYGSIKFAQEIDPISGVPTRSSEWYSSCMLAFAYGVRRLGLL